MCKIQRFYIFRKNDWKRHQNSLVLWIMTKHFACVFFGGKEINVLILFLKLIHLKFRQYISLPSIVVTNRHSIVIAAERSVITLVVNMSTCKYNWKGLNESAFPAHLYLSQYYIFRDHSVNFTVDLTQGVFIDRFHSIDPTKTYNFKAPTLVTSASHKITAKCGILSKDTAFNGETGPRHTFLCNSCNVCPLAIPQSCAHN